VKISRITTYILKVPLGEKRFYSSQCAFPERNSLLVSIETDDGLIGWGEGGQYGPAEPVASCINDVLATGLIGKNPLDTGCLWEEMYALTRDFGQRGPYIEAISAIDIALWDLKGKHLRLPVYQLLGGSFRDTVPAYATGCYYRGENVLDLDISLKELAREAAGYVEAGFSILKIKVGLPRIEEDLQRLKAIREAIGPRVQLLVDCNHAYNATNAIRMGRHLEEHGVVFFEEPVPPEDLGGYRAVRQALDLAIAGGENVYTRFGFRDLILNDCIDIAQPNIGVCGGFTEFMNIQAMTSAHGVRVIPHVWGSGVSMAAALHAVATLPPMPHTAHPVALQNEPVIEYDRNPNPLRDELIEGGIPFHKGCLHVPDGPGLGININTAVLERYLQGNV